MTFKIIMFVIIALLLVLNYSLIVVAHDADEQAKKMYKLLKERQDLPIRRNPDGTFDVHYKADKPYRAVWVDENFDEIGADNE